MGLVRRTSAGSLESVSVSAFSAACQSTVGILFSRDATNTKYNQNNFGDRREVQLIRKVEFNQSYGMFNNEQ